jgi:hypothetical protein
VNERQEFWDYETEVAAEWARKDFLRLLIDEYLLESKTKEQTQKDSRPI